MSETIGFDTERETSCSKLHENTSKDELENAQQSQDEDDPTYEMIEEKDPPDSGVHWLAQSEMRQMPDSDKTDRRTITSALLSFVDSMSDYELLRLLASKGGEIENKEGMLKDQLLTVINQECTSLSTKQSVKEESKKAMTSTVPRAINEDGHDREDESSIEDVAKAWGNWEDA